MKVKLAACLLAVSLALPLSGCSEQEPGEAGSDYRFPA